MSIFSPEVEEVGLPLIQDQIESAPPFVNLLPLEIVERRALKRLTHFLAAGVLAAVAVTGGIVYTAGSGKAEAAASLASAQSETAHLQQQLKSLSSARDAQAQLQAAQAALKSAMSNEVLWSSYMDQVRLQLPDGVRLSNFAVAPAGSVGTGSAPAGAPATTTTTAGSAAGGSTSSGAIATITISGKAVSQDAVANWLDALPRIKGFTNVFLTSTAPDGSSGLVTFSVTVDVTSAALSHRYDNQIGN